MPCVSASTASRVVGIEVGELGAEALELGAAHVFAERRAATLTSGATSRAARSAR